MSLTKIVRLDIIISLDTQMKQISEMIEKAKILFLQKEERKIIRQKKIKKFTPIAILCAFIHALAFSSVILLPTHPFSLFIISTASLFAMTIMAIIHVMIARNYQLFNQNNYTELNYEQKLEIKNALLNHHELIDYNNERLQEKREWMLFDYHLITEYVKCKSLILIDNELNQMTKKPEKIAKYLSSSL